MSDPATPRPILIDPADGPCEICAGWEAGRAKAGRPTCQRCGGAVLPFQNMGGNGFQSVKPHHWHLELVGDTSGRRGKYQELCHDCYQADHKAAYPNLPVPQLPLVLTDPNARQDARLFRPADGTVEVHEE